MIYIGSSDEFAVYIRGGDSGTIYGLGGDYNIYITTGNDWDDKTRKFKINPNYYKLIEPIHIVNQLWDWRGDGRFHQVTYEIWTLNIDRLLINNTMTSKISENEFINLERIKNETELYEMKYQNLKIHQERYNQSL